MSNSLRQQVAGMIETCKTVLARGKELPGVDATTARIAITILAEAKAQNPDDKVLNAVALPEEQGLYLWNWTSILSAMETVQNSLPLPQQARPRPYSNRR
jgi:hypothetical protein